MAKTRLLVLGGGMGSLAALMEITSRPNWRDRFDITLLQRGWRLGGKCASSRDPAQRYRNEEHGLHVLGGFYHNTFRMLRSCYEEWNAIPFGEAFENKESFFLAQKLHGEWSGVEIALGGSGEPGIDPPILRPLDIAKSLVATVGDLRFLLPDGLEVNGQQGRLFNDAFEEAAEDLQALELRDANAGRLKELVSLLRPLELTIQNLPPDALRKAPEPILPDDPELGKLLGLVLIELGLLVPRAMIEDAIIFNGFDIINNYDSLEWLRRHSASERLLESTFINSGYEYAFAYIDGDLSKKNFAAGVALRGLLRLLLTFHASVFIHMRGGMGEIVIVPLYEVLARRGVKFKFFHEVTRLVPTDDGNEIAGVEGLVQAEPIAGPDGYEPLLDWNGRKFWPHKPKYELLVNGDELRRQGRDFESQWASTEGMRQFRFAKDDDFDLVVLGIPSGALKSICGELANRHPRWRRFLGTQKTTPTIGAQFWLTKPLKELGWDGEPPLLTGYERPLSTWSDMSFLLPFEEGGLSSPYCNLSYVCGPLPRAERLPERPDATFPARETARAQSTFKDWLRSALADLWPLAGNEANDDFDPALRPEIYMRANINPSDEYVLSPAGSIPSRFKTDETDLSNLLVVGDWIRTGLDVGAVEAAVTSGLQCARAITGRPQFIYGETDFM